MLRAGAAPARCRAGSRTAPRRTAHAATARGSSIRRWSCGAATALRVALDNALDEPTIVHWHGLTVDERNDGDGRVLAAPGGRYDYAFEVRNRAGLYWYHPHPHGDTAGQVHDGLYRAPRRRGRRRRSRCAARSTSRPAPRELTLVLQDRRPAALRAHAE